MCVRVRVLVCVYIDRQKESRVVVTHTCDPSYSGGRDQEDQV
jgi:hypothetical protein